MALRINQRSAEKMLTEFPGAFTEKERRRIKRRSPNKKKTEPAPPLKGLEYGRTIIITEGDVRQPGASVPGRY